MRWFGTEQRRGSHMPFNFALVADLNRNSPAADFKTAIDNWLTRVPSFGEPNWVLGNHDRSRIGFRYGENRHESLAIMTMLLPGMNVVYYVSFALMHFAQLPIANIQGRRDSDDRQPRHHMGGDRRPASVSDEQLSLPGAHPRPRSNSIPVGRLDACRLLRRSEDLASRSRQLLGSQLESSNRSYSKHLQALPAPHSVAQGGDFQKWNIQVNGCEP